MMPNTYTLYSDDDIARLEKEYDENKLYILKKNIQRQSGLQITDSLNDILNCDDDYVVVQELLQDPYTINGRKINMRFYVLIICNNNNMDVYVYNNGFMYYTKDKFIKNSKEKDPNITTGYIDRSVYEKNPLTHEDFRNYLDQSRELSLYESSIYNKGLKLSDVVFKRIYNLLKDVFMALSNNVCNKNKLKSAISFQLFGVDIALNDQLYPMLMEANKGPDLGSKDERDGYVKNNCAEDTLEIVGIINKKNNKKNGFIKIIDKENDRFNNLTI